MKLPAMAIRALACAALLSLFVVSAPEGVRAAVIDKACDPEFMDKLKERAWMEAQREIMNNQQMIAKPDSVLALSCYDSWMSSMTSSFSKDNGSGLNSTKNQANTYLQSSYNHSLGGGNQGGSNSSNCGNIKSLWESAECKNLELSQILTLKDASTNDPRKQPKSCGNSGSWDDPIKNLTTAGAGVGFDKMNLFTSIVAPLSETGTSGGSKKCAAGIPTGVFLGDDKNPEIVCPNPGCSPDGGSSPKCCETGSTSSSCSAAYSGSGG